MPTVRCDGCGAEKEARPGKEVDAKLPGGYKVLGGRTLCKACRDATYVMRAVTVPVSVAIDAGEDDVRDAVFRCWGRATNAANAIVTELARHERPARDERGVRLAPPPKLNTYRSARLLEPEMDPASVSALDQAVRGKYRASRVNVFCRGVESLPVYRFPTPYPIRKAEWGCLAMPGGERCVRARFAGRWWSLKLILDGRQIPAWEQLVSGEAERCELAILGRPVTASDDRPGLRMRVPGKPAKRLVRVMAKLVGWFPRRRPDADAPSRALYCETGPDRLWTYRIGEAGEPRYFHADGVVALDRQQAKRLEAIDVIARGVERRHEARVDRMAHDTKHEKRWPKRRRRKLLAGQDRRVRKFRDRMDTFTHEASKMLAEFARRNRITTVVYDDRDRSFSERFPYYELAERLAYKLQERGIAFERVGKDATD